MIAVFAGSFNPVTRAHVKIVETVLNINEVGKVIVMPLNDNYYKQGLIEAKYRYNMLKECFKSYNKVELSTLDMDSDKQLTTIEYMDIFAEQYNEQPAYILGTDNFKHMSKWNDAEKLIEKYMHIVIKRDDDDLNKIIENDELYKKYKQKFIIIDNREFDINRGISATKARDAIKDNDETTCRMCLTDEVVEYIKKNGLYR